MAVVDHYASDQKVVAITQSPGRVCVNPSRPTDSRRGTYSWALITPPALSTTYTPLALSPASRWFASSVP